MGPLFGYCNKPSLGPWTRSRGTVPPSSCRYINSGAIIGVCAFSQSPLGPAAASLSYSFYLCYFPLCLSSTFIVSTPSLCVFTSFFLCRDSYPTYLPPSPLSLSFSFFLWLASTSLAHPLTRPPYPFASHSFHLDHGSLHRPWLVCFPSRRLPFAKRTLNYAADDKYLSRPLRERATTDLCPDRCYLLRLALLASSVDRVTL